MLTAIVSLVPQMLAAGMIPPPPLPRNGAALPPLHVGSTELACPVGGERFTAVTTNMWSITGRRPDEKPYSEVAFPRPLPECPGNGLVVFANFTPAETAQLADWISTPVYQAMRKTESPFYRAYWLAMKIHRPEADAIEQLLPAIWEAKEEDGKDPKRPRTARYQRVLVNAVEHVSSAVSLDDKIWLRGQAANALREMGEFKAAERMRQEAASQLPNSTRPALADYLNKLQAVIARHDRSDEPLNMIPNVQAALKCKHEEKQSPFDQAYCQQPSIASIFKRVDVNAPAEVARRNAMWGKIVDDAKACHVRLRDSKLTDQDATTLGFSYRLEPNTPEAQHCMFERQFHASGQAQQPPTPSN